MAPVDIQHQTNEIVRYLFMDEDEDEIQPRCSDGQIEADCTESQDDFDPVLVADKLRTIGDSLVNDSRFGAVLCDLKKAAAKEALEVAFSKSVEALCETHSAKAAEVAPEVQLIKASVALGVHVAKAAPELKSKVRDALSSFLSNRVGGWVAQQGGWDKVREL